MTLNLPIPSHTYTFNKMATATVTTPIPPPFFSPYLDDQSGKIQAKGVPWEVRAFPPVPRGEVMSDFIGLSTSQAPLG
jgi:hypothetical protein